MINDYNFSELDKKIAVAMVRKLPQKERRAIILRFWDELRVDEIATRMRMSWQETNLLIESGLTKLKGQCVESPCFSKAV
jgi:DNA-directed RNA polymerase specialized sigma24 family protein